jgi:hypothetical protein
VRGGSRAGASGRLPALVALAMVALAGCSGGDEPPRTPVGFSEYRDDVYAFAYPRGWSQNRTLDERKMPVVDVHGDQAANGAYRGQVIVSRRDRFQGSMEDMLGQARALNKVYGRQILSEEPVKVHGAKEARRVEAVYDQRSSDGTTVKIRSVDVYALTGKGTMLDLTARAAQADFDAVGLPKVVSSFRLTG